jgi:hypothetical protein
MYPWTTVRVFDPEVLEILDQNSLKTGIFGEYLNWNIRSLCMSGLNENEKQLCLEIPKGKALIPLGC